MREALARPLGLSTARRRPLGRPLTGPTRAHVRANQTTGWTSGQAARWTQAGLVGVVAGVTSPLRVAVAARIQTAAAAITAQAEARIAEIDAAAGAGGKRRRSRAQRAAEQAARREVWAWRAAEIDRVTAAIRAEARAVEAGESRRRSQVHRAGTRARSAQARMDRRTWHIEDVGRAETALQTALETALYEAEKRSL